jgi:hypothetical protein
MPPSWAASSSAQIHSRLTASSGTTHARTSQGAGSAYGGQAQPYQGWSTAYTVSSVLQQLLGFLLVDESIDQDYGK